MKPGMPPAVQDISCPLRMPPARTCRSVHTRPGRQAAAEKQGPAAAADGMLRRSFATEGAAVIPSLPAVSSCRRRSSPLKTAVAAFTLCSAVGAAGAAAGQQEIQSFSAPASVPPPLPATMQSPFRPLVASIDETRHPAGSVQYGTQRWLLFKDSAGRLHRTEETRQ